MIWYELIMTSTQCMEIMISPMYADPVTVAVVGMGLGAAGTVMSVKGARERAAAEKKALRGKARLQALKADERLVQLETELDIFETKKEIAMGDSISSYAKAGVALSGSPLMALASNERELQSSLAEMERKGLKEAELIRAGAQGLNDAASDIDTSAEEAGIILNGLAGGMSQFPTGKG